MKFFGARLLVAAALLVPAPAMAASFLCTASPSVYLGVSADGTVYTDIENVGVSGICSLTSTVDGVTPQGCAGWYSALLTQRAASRTVILHYNDPNATSCSNFTAWSVHAPYYFLLNN